MNLDFLELPRREQKPRSQGANCLIDTGLPLGLFKDYIMSHSKYIDSVKFGWGLSYLDQEIQEKTQLLNNYHIDYWLGGSFFEIAYAQSKLAEYLAFCNELGAKYVEVSDGTIEISRQDKLAMIEKIARDFTVLSEVGYKDDRTLFAHEWVDFIKQELNAGARKIIMEGRESGKAGIYDEKGNINKEIIELIAREGISIDSLIFEAPNKSNQVYFIKKFGNNVNLSNLPFSDILKVESLRMGLRGDTLYTNVDK